MKIDCRCGESLTFSGRVYTARDAAVKRMLSEYGQGIAPPFCTDGAIIYFAGPTAAPPGYPVGAIGPTTSGRMERYLPELFSLGIAGFIGKGGFGTESAALFKKHRGYYLCAVGGAGALYAECVRSALVVAYPELGCEAVRELTVEDMPLLCAIDSEGRSIFS